MGRRFTAAGILPRTSAWPRAMTAGRPRAGPEPACPTLAAVERGPVDPDRPSKVHRPGRQPAPRGLPPEGYVCAAARLRDDRLEAVAPLPLG